MKANCKGYAEVLQYAQSLRCKAQTDYLMMAQSNLDTQNLANRISLEETEVLLRDILNWDRDYKEQTLKQRPITEDVALALMNVVLLRMVMFILVQDGKE